MFLFFIAACALGFFAARRWHDLFGYGPGWHRGRHRGLRSYRHRGGPWSLFQHLREARRRFLMRRLFEELDTTPGQERAIAQSVDTFTDQLAIGRDDLRSARRQFAQALAGDVFDDSALNAVFVRVDEVAAKAKTDLTRALQEIHSSLDGRQRQQLAELIADGYGSLRYGRSARDYALHA